MNAGKGKKYTFETVTSFGEKNLAEGLILKQTLLPNGVTRLQLPREAWHNSDSYLNSVIKIGSENIKGIKTLWPVSFSISDISRATESIIQQNPGSIQKISGIFNSIKINVTRSSTGKVISSFPSWNQ